jgi:hypothetical protein
MVSVLAHPARGYGRGVGLGPTPCRAQLDLLKPCSVDARS